jgi:hypothetical protein
MKTKSFILRIPEELHTQVKTLAAAIDSNMHDFMIDLIAGRLEDTKFMKTLLDGTKYVNEVR